MKWIQNQHGFTMVEAMVAAAILLLGGLLMLNLFVNGYYQTTASGHLTEALNLARAQLEQIRNTPFSEIPTTFPPNEENPEVIPSLPEGRRSVSYPQGTSTEPLAVRVKVQWSEENVTHKVTLDTLIANADL